MGNPTGNNAPIPLDDSEPDGDVIKVKQLDDFIRETRLQLKTFLERSHVHFDDPKAGEMKPGTALPAVDTAANLRAAGVYPPAAWSGRLGLSHNRDLWSWRDLGGGLEAYRVGHMPLIQGVTYEEVTSSALQANIAASAWTEVGPGATVSLSGFTRRDFSPLVSIRMRYAIPVLNASGSERGVTARFKYSIGAEYVTPGGLTMQTHTPVRLRQNTGATLLGEAWILGGALFVPGGQFNVRAEVFADGNQVSICGDLVAGQANAAFINATIMHHPSS